MPDYRETSVSAKSWQRCNQVSIHNPYQAPPVIFMQEEQITETGGTFVSVPKAGLQFGFDPGKVIPLRNPMTGELLGATMTFQEMYIALWSLYIDSALKRDLAVATSAETQANQELASAVAMREAIEASLQDATNRLDVWSTQVTSLNAELDQQTSLVATKTTEVNTALDDVNSKTSDQEADQMSLSADPENPLLVTALEESTAALNAAIAVLNGLQSELSTATSAVSELQAQIVLAIQNKDKAQLDVTNFTTSLAEVTALWSAKADAASAATAAADEARATATANGIT